MLLAVWTVLLIVALLAGLAWWNTEVGRFGPVRLLAGMAADRPLEISNGRQTILLLSRMPEEALRRHRTCVSGLG